MYRLNIILKQHTPLIHFQHDQEGATLRASEVKPLLDRYLIQNALDNDFENAKNFLIGYDVRKENALLEKYNNGFKALNYKIRITSSDRVQSLILRNEQRQNTNKKTKWYSYWEKIHDKPIDFPLILSNMGGKDSEDELLNLSMYKGDTIIDFLIPDDELYVYIKDWIDLFFATHNFGQRSTKGFGSFSVTKIIDKDNNVAIKNFPQRDLPKGTPFLKFNLSGKNDRQKQFCIFQTIDFYWKCLKSGINFTRDGQYPDRYIKSFLWIYLDKNGKTWEKRFIKEKFDLRTESEYQENSHPRSFARALLGCPDKFEYKNKRKTIEITHNENDEENKIARIPTPIIFKPIFTNDDVRVYLMFNDTIQENVRKNNNKSFKFTCENKTELLDIDPDSIIYKSLIQEYHDFLDKTVAKSYFQNDEDDEKYQSFVDNHELNNKRWFIPLDFNWKNILGNNKWVELYKTKQ